MARTRRLHGGEAGFRALHSCYKTGAKNRGLPWSISESEFARLNGLPCTYCGRPPHAKYYQGGRPDSAYTYTGIDRLDNRLGYEPGNCVPCCGTCNNAKGSLTAAQFVRWIDDLIANRASLNIDTSAAELPEHRWQKGIRSHTEDSVQLWLDAVPKNH